MYPALALRLVNSWDTVRYELLNSRICDLGLQIEGSPLEPFTDRLHRELARKGLKFKPEFYLTDGWGCPDEVPVIVRSHIPTEQLESQLIGEPPSDRIDLLSDCAVLHSLQRPARAAAVSVCAAR